MQIIRYILTFSLLLSSMAIAANDRYYRYTDTNGTVVINSAINPDRAALGYDILDANGRLVERVAPALSGDEFAIQSQQDQQAKKQQEYDISLLQRYSFVGDIEAEQKRQVAQLNTRSAILRGNLNSFRFDLEKTYEQAADFERQNKPMPDSLKKRIESLEERITVTKQMLNNQMQEIEKMNQEYLRAIERFKELEVLRGRSAAP